MQSETGGIRLDGKALFTAVMPVVERARQAVLEVYRSGDFDTQEKADHSPVTAADTASHRILSEGLADIWPGAPVISEESRGADKIDQIQYFWLVDPLDGTKEFIRKSGEFTINVALVGEGGVPIWGLVDVPLMARTYVGGLGSAFWSEGAKLTSLPALRVMESKEPKRVALSRSHQGAVDEWLKDRHVPVADLIYAGSAVKFCWVAEGSVDLYVRLLPTMGWDTAAGQALVESVGGTVTALDGGRLTYRPCSEVNPRFIAARPSTRGFGD